MARMNPEGFAPSGFLHFPPHFFVLSSALGNPSPKKNPHIIQPLYALMIQCLTAFTHRGANIQEKQIMKCERRSYRMRWIPFESREVTHISLLPK
jgi:hypothetical protein